MAPDGRPEPPPTCDGCGLPWDTVRPTPDRGGANLCSRCWANSRPDGPFDRGRGRLRRPEP